MARRPALDWNAIVARQNAVDPSNDPRVGSARNGSTGGTLSHVTSSGTDSASASSLGSTFVPVAVFSAVCILIFIYLRRKCSRVYAPRTIKGIRPEPCELCPPLPSGWVNWVIPFLRIPNDVVLKYASLDGFLFLRYLRVLAILCLVGVCVAWPVLLPLHATGGQGLTQLDLFTIGNVDNPNKLYATVGIAYIFFGFVLYMISRECMYYVNLRQAYLLSPDYVHRLSSRTVLFTCVPRNFLDEAKLRKLFGDSVKNVWIPRNTKLLQSLVSDREKTATKLETAEIQLIKDVDRARRKVGVKPEPVASPRTSATVTAVASPTEKDLRRKSTSSNAAIDKTEVDLRQITSNTASSDSVAVADDKALKDLEYTHPYGLDSSLPDVRGSVAAQWVAAEDRPSHRPMGNFFRRVDTIRWCRLRLKVLNMQIGKLRRKMRRGYGSPISAAFVEFDSLANAQAAFQILAHHQPLHMSPKFIGVKPNEIVWKTLRMKWWERIMRRFGVMALIAAAILFWSIPSALVGTISNIKYLAQNVPFLFWILDLPGPITGVIEGLLPALALSLLMMLVPSLCRACARMAGVPTQPLVELYSQSAYFAFQVVQVFLVTTLTSAASAAFQSILQDPLSAKDLLSQSLPKASNFYLSYVLVQCLAGAASGFLHIPDLFRQYVLAWTTDNPRKAFRRWHRLRQVHWGARYPVFSNLGVIILSYSCIAPLVLAFAGLGMVFTGVVYKYNLMYVFDSGMDTHGLFYPRALMHLMVGLYIAEICLIGLFALQSAAIPVVLMVLYLIFTGLIHVSLNEALSPLFQGLPRSLALMSEQPEGFADNGNADDPESQPQAPTDPNVGAAAEYYDVEEAMGEQDEVEHGPYTERMDDAAVGEDIEDNHSARGIVSSIVKWSTTRAANKVKSEIESVEQSNAALGRFRQWMTPDPNKTPNFFVRWLHPEIYEDFNVLRQRIPATLPQAEPSEEDARRCYWPREMWLRQPRLWIPRDEAHVSRQEVAHTRDILPISDHGAWLDNKSRVIVDLNEAPWTDDGSIYWNFEHWT